MQVLTLDPEALDSHAARLSEIVAAAHPSGFDAIVAVRRGGAFVCDAFCRHFPQSLYGGRFDVTLQRPSTRRKRGIVNGILRILPYSILNIIRMGEAYLLRLREGGAKKSSTCLPHRHVSLPEELISKITDADSPDILIIDDAIDSGNTLFAIVRTLKHTNPDAKVQTAVLTQTTEHPRIYPHYSLYSNRTLIRFPWSNDYKTKI